MTLYDLENKIFKALCSTENMSLKLLIDQREASEISSIEETGVGIYYTYSNESFTEKKFRKDFNFGDISLKIPGLALPVGVVVYIREGAISLMELYTHDESWPTELKNIEISNVNEVRDLSEIENARACKLN